MTQKFLIEVTNLISLFVSHFMLNYIIRRSTFIKSLSILQGSNQYFPLVLGHHVLFNLNTVEIYSILHFV